jgi:hypothetical protein
MVDAVDSLLNNTVDLYVQAVDYCRISTSQISTPVGTRIQQIKPKSGDVRQMSPDFGDTMPDSSQTSWNLAGSGQNFGDRAIWSESWMDPAVWPRYWPERPDLAVLAESPASWPETG